MKNGFSIAALAVFLLSGCVSDRPQEAKNAYESDYERFFQNVIVKEKTSHYVTYGQLLTVWSCKTSRLFLYKI